MNSRRTIQTGTVRREVIDLLYRANFSLPPAAIERFAEMRKEESSPLAAGVLDVLRENAEIARDEEIALCQDCGVVNIFLEVGQDVMLEGEDLYPSIQEGIKEAYDKYYLRKSMVGDPLRRINTGTNTPGFIHMEMTGGDRIKLTVYLKGGGSENMSVLRMFRPTAPRGEILEFIERSVIEAGPNPCPPLFLGIGIGGTADIALLNSRKALFRGTQPHPDPFYASLEEEIRDRLNRTGIGPLGFGGRATVGGVWIREAPTHIATLPLALNMNCHALRYGEALI